jgi:hypothetical protein
MIIDAFCDVWERNQENDAVLCRVLRFRPRSIDTVIQLPVLNQNSIKNSKDSCILNLLLVRKERKKDEIAKNNWQNKKRQYCYLQEDYNYTSQTLIFKNQTCKPPIDKGQNLELTSKQAIEVNESSSQVKHWDQSIIPTSSFCFLLSLSALNI